MSSAKLVWITPDAEKMIGYIARVSNPNNQDNPEVAGLLKYCIKNKHWSIFEQASFSIEIATSRAISAQILRHRSFCFQEFSQRYAAVTEFEVYEARRQDSKNRQNSVDDMPDGIKNWFKSAQECVQHVAMEQYNKALEFGIAKEQARFLLPMSTSTKLYMTGNLRNWIHYLELRTEKGTQLEHREIAEAIKGIFKEQLPIISEALGW